MVTLTASMTIVPVIGVGTVLTIVSVATTYWLGSSRDDEIVLGLFVACYMEQCKEIDGMLNTVPDFLISCRATNIIAVILGGLSTFVAFVWVMRRRDTNIRRRNDHMPSLVLGTSILAAILVWITMVVFGAKYRQLVKIDEDFGYSFFLDGVGSFFLLVGGIGFKVVATKYKPSLNTEPSPNTRQNVIYTYPGVVALPNAPYTGASIPPNAPYTGASVPPNAPYTGASVPPNAPYTGASVPPNAPYQSASMPLNAPYQSASMPPNVPYQSASMPPNVPYQSASMPPSAPYPGASELPKAPYQDAPAYNSYNLQQQQQANNFQLQSLAYAHHQVTTMQPPPPPPPTYSECFGEQPNLTEQKDHTLTGRQYRPEEVTKCAPDINEV